MDVVRDEPKKYAKAVKDKWHGLRCAIGSG